MISNTDSIYFAAKQPEETAGILLDKAKSFFTVLRSNNYLDKLRKMWKAYHGIYGNIYSDSHEISFTGEEGELVHFPVNHFRNLAQHILVMITANRPIMEARAANTDYKSFAQTILANGILDYYMREKHLEDIFKQAVEMSIVFGAGFIKMEWNATLGETYEYDEDTGQFQYQGDLEFSTLSPLDVIVDGTKESWNHDWVMVRTWKNRFDLIAKYPEMADKIRSIPTKSDISIYKLSTFSNDQTDDIPVFEFYHKKTESMQEGRYILFLSEDAILLDAKLPYPMIPVFRIAPSNFMGTPYGYSPMFDVFPIQELINSTYSIIATNQNAFGVQNVWVQPGSGINLTTIAGGLNIIESISKPEAIQLTATPKEVFDYLQMLIQASETISGVNAVSRGDPQASLKSGTALALVQSMALQFISGLQQSYVRLIEDVGTGIIEMLKNFAHAPRIVSIIGKNNRYLTKEYTGDNLKDIQRVVVDVGNPLSRTTAGRVQMAEQMLQMGLIKTPEQYFQVINTGRLESMYEDDTRELMFIKAENEALMDGKPVIATFLDRHRMHIIEHRSLIADPDIRQDPQLVGAVLEHIQHHIDFLRNTDPDTLMLIGEQPLAPPGQSPENFGPQAPVPASGGPAPEMMQNPNTAQQSPNVQGAQLPSPAQPPAPFQNLPTNPKDMGPQ